MLEVLAGSFLIGSVGALVIVWLRWIGTLPRFSSSVEIGIIEDEYKELSTFMSTKIRGKNAITDPEVQHSNNLRDDIWRQRTKSFAVSALMYVVLGGATAVLFVGIETNNLTDLIDPLVIGKLISTGALWSSFYSFIDVKKTDEAIEAIRENMDAETMKKVDNLKKNFEDKLKNKIDEGNNTITKLVNKYNNLVEKYEKLKRNVS